MDNLWMKAQMARYSRIEWTDHTFNPWWGCTKVSPACDHCYAEAWARRLGMDVWSAGKPRRFLSEAYWRQPHRWDSEAARTGERARVFCASMADVFEWKKGLSPWRHRLWELIEQTPNLDWLLLTKRPHLAEAPARIRFLSCEPLLGEVDLEHWLQEDAVHWVIAGGESGPRARPSDPGWFYGIRDQCLAHDTPFHFKQWGDWAPVDAVPGAVPKSIANGNAYSTAMGRFGKKAAGRVLGDQTWDGLPVSLAAP